MELGFFTMPIHPLDKDWRVSLREDREAFLLADELGFKEAYVGEHVTDKAEQITSCTMFMASLAYATKNIRLGTGTVNMPNSHPAAVAAQVAMLDHMLDGRFNFGISPGGLATDAEVFGNIDADRNEMFLECINTVLKIVTAVAPFSKGVTEAAARGWDPISANFLMPQWVASHWPKYVEGCERAGRKADPANWRVAKSVFVADDLDTAREYATNPKSPYRYYYSQLLTKMRKHGRVNLFKEYKDQPDDEVTLDKVCDKLIIWGTPDKVADELLAFREETGEFGTLLLAGKDWADVELSRRSKILMAEQVKDKVNDAEKSATKAAQ